MPIKEARKIIKDVDKFTTKLGEYKLFPYDILGEKGLTKSVQFNLDKGVLAGLTSNFGVEEVESVSNDMKKDILNKGYKILYEGDVVGNGGSTFIAEKGDKIIAFRYYKYQGTFSVHIRLTNKEILDDQEAYEITFKEDYPSDEGNDIF